MCSESSRHLGPSAELGSRSDLNLTVTRLEAGPAGRFSNSVEYWGGTQTGHRVSAENKSNLPPLPPHMQPSPPPPLRNRRLRIYLESCAINTFVTHIRWLELLFCRLGALWPGSLQSLES